MAGVDEGASGRLGGAGQLVVLLRGPHGGQGASKSPATRKLQGRRRLLTCGEGLCSDSGSTAARLRVLGVAAGVDGCRGRLGPLFVGRRPTWACAPRMEGRRNHAGDRGRALREEEDGSGRWAQAVSDNGVGRAGRALCGREAPAG